MSARDEFYIGYLDRAPPGIARVMRRTTAGLLLLAAFVAGLVIGAMRPFGDGHYAFGQVERITGVIVETPVPAVLVERAGGPGRLPGFARYLLAGPGKFGAEAMVAGLHGRVVELTGERIRRDAQVQFKLQAGGVEPLDNTAHQQRAARWSARAAAGRSLGEQTLRGEIVDSQCFLGIMKPGYGKPHRACAVRCLSGGIPPLFYGRGTHGKAGYYLVLGADGEVINRELLPYVADLLELRGEVISYPQLTVIRLRGLRRLG